MLRYFRSDQSSDTRSSTAVASVSALASFGKTPTTRVRRFTSRKTRSPRLRPLSGRRLDGQHFAVALIADAHGHQQRHLADGPRPPRLEVGRVEVEVRVAPGLVELPGTPLGEGVIEASGDAAHGILRDPRAGELAGDLLDLPGRDALVNRPGFAGDSKL